jgi:hypothetical protein
MTDGFMFNTMAVLKSEHFKLTRSVLYIFENKFEYKICLSFKTTNTSTPWSSIQTQ